MAESANNVLHELTAAGLLSSDHATKYGVEIETGSEALLSRLISDGHITEFQADKFRAGKASDIYFGDYVVIDKLGQGGMGTVLLAKHRRMDRKVAIKVLPVTVLESKDAVARFYQEVKVAAQLTHPSIVHAYDAGEHHGFHYLVMEYVPGHDLAQVLSQLGLIPSSLAMDYILQTASGLEYAHNKGIVHRDIKPSNLLLNDEGTIKILDMGLARIGNALDQESSLHLTTTGQVMGTVEYMSPEQAEDTRQADARSDIYSLGCTLYRLVTGKGPYSRDTIVKTILAHRDAEIPVIDTGSPDDEALNQLFQKMVAKDPADRFQTVTELITAIRMIEDENVLEDNDTPAPRDQALNTAIAVRLEDSEAHGIPEAIIPEYVDPVLIAAPDPNPTLPASSIKSGISGRTSNQSEIMYIPDIKPTGLVRRIRDEIKNNRSLGILLWSLASFCLMAIGVGVITGWFTWRAANQDLRNIENGRRDSRWYWMTMTGKMISIIAVCFGTLLSLAFLTLATRY